MHSSPGPSLASCAQSGPTPLGTLCAAPPHPPTTHLVFTGLRCVGALLAVGEGGVLWARGKDGTRSAGCASNLRGGATQVCREVRGRGVLWARGKDAHGQLAVPQTCGRGHTGMQEVWGRGVLAAGAWQGQHTGKQGHHHTNPTPPHPTRTAPAPGPAAETQPPPLPRLVPACASSRCTAPPKSPTRARLPPSPPLEQPARPQPTAPT